LIESGIELARQGGPEAVVLREATRRVGVVPNAAYRHFKDRDALLTAVCVAAMRQLAQRMEEDAARVSAGPATRHGAEARLSAIGRAYLDFAMTEPGLFETAFAVPRHLDYATDQAAAGPGGRTPLQLLGDALDELADAGVLPPARRPNAEYAVWSSVHGMAVLVNRGPLRQIPQGDRTQLIDSLLAFILRGL
jgi:AcrR family transcriptional regulator